MFLNCHTWFSFKYGTLSADRFFDECKRNNVHKVVITEINNTASYIELLRIIEERKSEFKLSIALGMEFRENHQLQFIVIAKNNNGFEAMNRYRSRLNNDSQAVPPRAPSISDTFIVYPFGKIEPNVLRKDEFIGVRTSQVSKYMLRPDYQSFKNKFVAWHPVSFGSKQEWNLHRLLRCIDLNILLSKLQATQHAPEDEIMMTEVELETKYRQFPELIQNAKRIIDACSIEFELGVDKNLKSLTGSAESDWEILVTNAWEGFHRIYDSSDAVLRERFERELKIIQLKDFGTYFLIAYDLIKFTKEKGYDTIGRGSGANSMVAYCLGITNVDPIELDLYFERFLNAERTTPPDFDIDFSWDQRDFIFDYLFEKYGRERTCLLGAHVTYQSRNTLRELGKVFGLPKEELDELSDHPEAIKDRDHITTLIFKYAERMYEMPASMTIHACGVLITEKPIYAYTSTFLPPKNYPVSNFEMHSAEDLGIYKFDILSQRGLGHIKEAARLISINKHIHVNVHDFPSFKKDEKVKELLRSSKCMGCFYVESPAMRSLLGKLQCEDYLTLVAASSIIRPGVSSSGMMKAYIERFHITRNGGRYESIHPKMDELMKETYGVMVYQEDVIKVAHHFAGLTLTEADVLRRAMSGKYRSRKAFEMIEQKFFANCRDFGYPEHVAQRVWFEIQSFGGYSFAKGHSASFAVESYQSLYLKAHYPLEFMVAVINNFGGFYTHEFYFHELRMSGGKIQAPCINSSELLTSIRGEEVHIGFDHLKSLEQKTVQAILADRKRNGPYANLIGFLKRVDIGLEQLRILIRIGAFRFTSKTKQELMWQAVFYFSEMKTKKNYTQDLFDHQFTEAVLPVLYRDTVQDAFDEIELLGFPLCDPFLLLGSEEKEDIFSHDMMNNLGKQVTMIGYYVTAKYTQTKHKQVMYFGTFYDRYGLVFDTVNFPDVARAYPFRGRGFYLIKGKVVEDFGVPALEVTYMEKLSLVHRQVNLPPAERTFVPTISLSA